MNLFDNDNQKYLIWDLETCNLNLLNNNLPWQIGFLLAEGNKIINSKSYMLKWPNLKVSEGAARATRFNMTEYKAKAVNPAPVLEEFESYLYNKDYSIIYHNGLGFDTYVHNIWRNALGKNEPDFSYLDRVYDTNALAKGIKLGIKRQKNQNFLAYQYSMLSIVQKGLKTNLTSLGKELGIEFNYETLHNATEDVKLNFIIWNKWIKNNI